MVKVDGGGLSAISHYSCLFDVRPAGFSYFNAHSRIPVRVIWANLCRLTAGGASTPPEFVSSIKRMRGRGFAMRAVIDARLRTSGGEKR